MNTGARVAVILILQTVVVFGMIAMKQYTLNTGTPILLETEPVDPRALFRGENVKLQYTINELNLQELGGDECYWNRDVIFVTLEQRKKYWDAVAAHHHRPRVAHGQVVIKGRVMWRGRDTSQACEEVYVEYLIEDYFVPEGKGRALEWATRDGQVDIRVAVDRHGNAGILAVLVDDVERYAETLF